MIEVANAVIVGPLTHRAALCFNGKEVAASSVFESEEESVVWGKEEWARLQERVGVDELKRLGWVTPELRYWP